ncbi:MAG: BamA/TamA family outer membrane protein [Calditrichaeota bacterium]|nr:BamA/TamA family outer membrane protein [Calditrichota bacterium]
MKAFRRFIFIGLLIGTGAASNMILAQIQFTIPKEVEPVQFNQRTDISSWNHYNRVEGLFAGLDVTLVPFSKKKVALAGGAGYGFALKAPRYHLFGIADFGKENHIQLGAGYFNHTVCNEAWIIGEIENSFAGVLLHEDFMDYYALKGWQGWAQFQVKDRFTLRGLFRAAEYGNLKKSTDWSLCPAKRKKFRSNPGVAAGKENLVRLSLIFDRLDNPIYPMKGIYVQIAGERSVLPANTTFSDYMGAFATLRWFQPTVENQKVSLQLRGAKVWNAAYLPQHLIDFGGIGTLQGYPYKAFKNASGVLLGRVVYGFEGDIMNSPVFSWIPFSDMIELSFFAEAGKGWFPETWNSVVSPPKTSIPFKYDAGLSLSISGDLIRLDLGHPIHEKEGQWRVTMRILPRW